MPRLPTFALLLLAATATPGQDLEVRALGTGVSSRSLRTVRELALAGLQQLGKALGAPTRRITVLVHADRGSVAPALLEELQEGVPGFARLQHDEIHLVLAHIGVDPPNDLRTTVVHELVHVLLDQLAGAGAPQLPRWFHEGLAQELSGGTYLGVQEEDLAYRVKARTYIPFHQLRESFPHHDRDELALAYGQSWSFVAFLRRKIGLEPLLQAARECGPEVPFRAAVARRLRRALVEYEAEWRDYILYESGAGYRAVLGNCFFLGLVAIGIPLLAIAVARRRNREEGFKRRMADEAETAADESLEDEEPYWLESEEEVPGAAPAAEPADCEVPERSDDASTPRTDRPGPPEGPPT
ncbi:MAG: hypothetical protein KDC87_17365 [Planctomycetes bacterium]|nr:hypothetical protein [Planctomycetota bacterium]MCB9872053.1 hypothetical protein [Planctomycetota bacterium]MCB9889776.1 hypothetical protein [Planctomycetota bacterium]